MGAFKRGLAQGMSTEEARAFSDQLYPPTTGDLAYQRELGTGKGAWAAAQAAAGRNGLASGRSFPWLSAASLLYPIGAALFIATKYTPPPPPVAIAGYGLANLGYLLVAAGVISGTFRTFGLTRRWPHRCRTSRLA